MTAFGFFLDASAAAPPGMGVGIARIGDLEEKFEYSLGRWRAEQYVEHWKATARRCRRLPGPHLFCTDVEETSVFAFVGQRKGEDFAFTEMLLFRRQIAQRWPFVRPRRPLKRHGPEVSIWKVPAAAIAAYAQM